MTNEDIQKLDSWEDIEYERIAVIVDTLLSAGIVSKSAYTYQWNSDTSLLYGTWSYEDDFEPVEESFLSTNCNLTEIQSIRETLGSGNK